MREMKQQLGVFLDYTRTATEGSALDAAVALLLLKA